MPFVPKFTCHDVHGEYSINHVSGVAIHELVDQAEENTKNLVTVPY